jgi:hypothetical protein
MKHNNALWREILKDFEITGIVEEGGVQMRRTSPDPSLGDQLHERSIMEGKDKWQAYFDACGKAPGASKGTRRKWLRRLGLG